MNDIDFIRDISGNFDFLEKIISEIILDNNGEILPHVIMGGIANYIQNISFEVNNNNEKVKDFLEYLGNKFLTESEEVKNIISLSFLYNLPYSGKKFDLITDILPQILLNELKTIRVPIKE